MEHNLLILRPSNIIGYETDKLRKRLNAYLISQLISNGHIEINCSPLTKKDIIPVPTFSYILYKLIEFNASGVFNVGCGNSYSLSDICNSLFSGYGHGSLASYSDQIIDEFELDCQKLFNKICDYHTDKLHPLEYIYHIGKTLRIHV